MTLLFLGELLFRQKENEEEYCLLPVVRKKFDIYAQKLWGKVTTLSCFEWDIPAILAGVRRYYRRQVLAAAAACAFLGIILCGMLYREPKGYVMPRTYTDWEEKSSIYLESADDPAYEGYRVMNYRDADTPMQMIEGNAVKLETIRYYVGSLLIGGLAGALIGTGTVILTDKERL